jgi:hypothetical protein
MFPLSVIPAKAIVRLRMIWRIQEGARRAPIHTHRCWMVVGAHGMRPRRTQWNASLQKSNFRRRGFTKVPLDRSCAGLYF